MLSGISMSGRRLWRFGNTTCQVGVHLKWTSGDVRRNVRIGSRFESARKVVLGVLCTAKARCRGATVGQLTDGGCVGSGAILKRLQAQASELSSG